jgi:hypothetical protein
MPLSFVKAFGNAIVKRAVAALKPGERAAVLMPKRFLFADGDDRRDPKLVRSWLSVQCPCGTLP